MKTAKSLALILLVLSAASVARPQQADRDVRRLSVPGLKWALEVSLPGFVVEQEQTRGDGKAVMIMAGIKEKGYVVSIFLEPIPHGENVKQLRDLGAGIKETSPFKLSDFKKSEYGQVPTLEYVIKEYQGMPVNQKHLNAYFVHDGHWVDIHFSKTLYEPGDEKLFYSVIDSVKFTEVASANTASAAPRGNLDVESSKLFIEGNTHFIHDEYKKAIGPYSKALELEKQNPRLPHYLWRVLVDNLTMAYGVTGDLKSAKETAEYGLSKDPDYPLFHYLMANNYAEMGDLDNTILYLKQAFARKQNMNDGERMPDPATDDSFKRFMNNEKFLAALKEIQK